MFASFSLWRKKPKHQSPPHMLLARLSPAAAAARPATARICSRPLTNMIAGLTGKKEKAEGGAVDAAEPRAPHELVLGA